MISLLCHQSDKNFPLICNNESENYITILPNQLVGQIDTDITKDEFKGIAQFNESDPSMNDKTYRENMLMLTELCETHHISSNQPKKLSSKPKQITEMDLLSPSSYKDLKGTSGFEENEIEVQRILAKQKHLNPFEREELLKQYREKGYIPDTVSNYTKSLPQTIEHKLDTKKPLTNQEMIDQIELDHLSNDVAVKVR